MAKEVRGIVRVISGILTYGRKEREILYLAKALTEESKCGFGLDYCHKVYRYEDLNTGVEYVQYIYDGSLVQKTWENFLTEGPDPTP